MTCENLSTHRALINTMEADVRSIILTANRVIPVTTVKEYLRKHTSSRGAATVTQRLHNAPDITVCNIGENTFGYHRVDLADVLNLTPDEIVARVAPFCFHGGARNTYITKNRLQRVMAVNTDPITIREITDAIEGGLQPYAGWFRVSYDNRGTVYNINESFFARYDVIS